MINENIRKLAQQAQLAMLYEVTCLNKPGLVDPVDSGSHHDMDIFTFIESSISLGPYFESFVQTGLELKEFPIIETFTLIRKIGLEAETAMFFATKGINTHKGAIFSLAIFLAVCGRLMIWQFPCEFHTLQREIKNMTKDLLTDFETINGSMLEELTWGEQLYVNYGLTGIRGEAQKGYPTIFDKGLPYYQKYQGTLQEQLLDTLLYISLQADDTTLMKRSNDINISEKYQPLICKYFTLGGTKTLAGKNFLKKLNSLFKEKNWSIGGSADLLIVTIFLAKVSNIGWLK
ncbi:triphosphoribosyl-dephospho-CoA synthase CitG [Enterococcus sp. DIV0086]|uniref:triphosphoribosyl-dephospho-CoA synthase CitG n=1 Tax=Enterococcus sp. DIV0086 TaxID=2774655 RepID=UPI003D26E3DE